jgi:peptide/nickel transport system permease protein
MTPQLEAELIKKFSLDQPWPSQLQLTFWPISGDLGYSYYYRDQVASVIWGALPGPCS